VRTIAVVTTSRADYGIYLPILRAIVRDRSLKLRLMVSGTHLSRAHGHTVDAIRRDGFKVADEILTNAVKGIAELVTKAGLVNLDFADIRTVMRGGGVALIGIGESDSSDRAVEAVEKAISNPLLNVDITGANGALINVSGGPDMTLEEARTVVQAVSEKLSDEANIIWGAQIYEDMSKTIRAMLIITGVQSPQIFGHGLTRGDKRKNEIENELGIQFIE